jgi:antirestriction protein ArdC
MKNRDARKEQIMQNSDRQDIYTRVTMKIVAALEQGVRPWMKPWSGENAAARISRPLRHDGAPYSGINILMLWGVSVEHGFTSPGWMTFRQALALNARVRKGEKGSLVVYANTFTKTKVVEGQEIDREIPFLKGYTLW